MKRGRQSVAERAVIPIAPLAPRLQPPADLGAEETALFRQLVASCPSDHFVESDQPLLTAYVIAICLSRRAAAKLAEDPSLATVWERSTRMLATLATRLRLAPQARVSPKTLARRAAAHRPSAYDFLEDP